MIDWKPWGELHRRFILNPIEQDARINILEGSIRSGKTVAMVPKWLEYIRRGPPGLLLMAGVTKETVYTNVLRDLFDTIGEDSFRYNSNRGELTIFWREGTAQRTRSIKVIGAKDEGSEKYIRGATLAGAYCDELCLMPKSFFEQLLNRLSVEGAKLYGTTNPDGPFHYLYTGYVDNDKRKDSGMVRVWHFALDDNPNLSQEYKDYIRGAYSGLWYDRMILGKWVLGSGLVYDMYSETLLFDEEPPGLRSQASRYIAVDYGTANPMVFLDIYDDGDTAWIVNEYYYDSRKERVQKEDTQYADDLLDFADGDWPLVIIDPSAASFKVTIKNRGFRAKDADNSVSDGIRMVGSLLHRGKIRIHRRCENLQKEFQSYTWDEKAAARGVEQPLKQNDHAMDALRYFVKTIIKKRRFAA